MSTSDLIECPERAAIPHWSNRIRMVTLAYWPQSRDCERRLMLALHRTTGQCHIDWVTIERAAEDVTNQARHLAQAMLAIREQSLVMYSKARDRQSTVLVR